MSQSQHYAPERIWLSTNQYGSIEGTWHKMEGLTPAIRELDRPVYEYTRSDICAALVEALEQMLYIFDRELDEGTIGRNVCDAARTALSQVKEGVK